MSDSGRKGFAAQGHRATKAQKILRVLEEQRHTAAGIRPTLLDIGTGSGEIAAYLSRHFNTISIDIVDQRTFREGYRFLRANEQLPFPGETFDVVVSNHVIEHVQHPQRHLAEIHRVLRPNGLAYLATPNRLWPWEVHYRLPLLHYLPADRFHAWLRRYGRFQEEIHLLTAFSLARMAHAFEISWISDRVCQMPRHYAMNVPISLDRLLRHLPKALFRWSRPFHPTFIVLLRKRP